MSAMALRIKRNPYFAIGFGAVLLMCVAQMLDINSNLTSLIPKLEWQMATGLLMVGILAFQWSLFFYKQTKNIQAIPRNRTLHKYAGIGFVILFALHADSFGHAWMTMLTFILTGIIITGLLNREIIAYRKPLDLQGLALDSRRAFSNVNALCHFAHHGRTCVRVTTGI